MPEVTPERVEQVLRAKIETAGYQADEIVVVQKSADAWLCEVAFPDEVGTRQAVVTMEEAAAPR